MASEPQRAKDPRARERLEEHEEVHDNFDTRISRNEAWRLQAQGALKFAALVVGSGIVVYFLQNGFL